MQRSQSSRRTPSWLITASLLLAAGAYYLFSFRPNQADLADLADELADNRESLASLETLPAQLQRTRGELDEAAAFLREFDGHAPSRPSSAVFSRISQSIEKSGCRAARFDPQAAEEYATLNRVRVNLEFEGAHSQVIAALAELEIHEQPTWLEDVRLSPGKSPQRDVRCAATVSVFSTKAAQPD
jgi:hypothetical protein